MYSNYYYRNGDRQFLVPFLLGGLAGGAAIGLTRPRPVYVNSPYNYRPYPNYPNYYSYYGGYMPY
ncbi:MAG: hypothetical protein IKP79_01580 [Bacilli bacterium]|nr:hypothetical protein [Bacilli bacterium]